MVFKVDETVVYPHHGAALIEKMKTRTIKGEDKIYLVLKVAQGDLTIEVPAENCDLVGVRDVVGQEGLERDNAMVAYSRLRSGDASSALRTVQSLEKFLMSQERRMQEIIDCPERKENVYNR